MISRVISTSRLLKVGQERARRGNCFLQSASSGFLESWRRNCDRREAYRGKRTIEWGWIRKLLTRGQRGKVSQLGDAFTRRSIGNLTRARDECPRYTRRDAAYNSRDTRSNTRHEWMIRGKPDFPWKNNYS